MFRGHDPLATLEATQHEPGDHHEYRLACVVCGQVGQVVVSVEPQRAVGPAWPDLADPPGAEFRNERLPGEEDPRPRGDGTAVNVRAAKEGDSRASRE